MLIWNKHLKMTPISERGACEIGKNSLQRKPPICLTEQSVRF